MPLYDMPIEQLEVYQPRRVEPPDFDAFWQGTLSEARQHPLNAQFQRAEFGLQLVEVFDVTFNGYGGQPIRGWFLLPAHHSAPLPCIVEYIGYGGGRGLPYNWLLWPSAGFASLVMDTRGQGSAWLNGDTPDLHDGGENPHYPGFMTRGILDPATYSYRRVFTDAVRAVEAARSHPAIDAGRIVVTGGSQGGGIALAVSGLEPSIAAALPDVPFLCHYERATRLVSTAPYSEIASYLKVHRDKVSTVFHTLSYFDGLNFTARAQARALFSVALMDDICPPSTVFAAYNHYHGPKAIEVYEYNQHEGGGVHQMREKLKFLDAMRTQ